MFRAIVRMLPAVILLAACGHEAKGDGEQGARAYAELAGAFCDRSIACLDELGLGQPWASRDACAELQATYLAARDQVECRPETDFDADADELATCIAAIAKAPCESVFWVGRLVGRAEAPEFAPCSKLAHELARREDERAGASAVGEPCSHEDQCTWDAFCVRPNVETCGVCRKLPKAREACLVGPEGFRYCEAGLTCDDSGTCVERGVAMEGESCTTSDTCVGGLECVDTGTCERLFEVGGACDGTFGSCGLFLECRDGACAEHPSRTKELGESCGPDDLCTSSRCLAGKCVPLAGLGEACSLQCEGCDYDCLRPYACVDGLCSDVPTCGTGGMGDVCSANDQCARGLRCLSSIEGREKPSRCGHAPGELGHACTEQSGCIRGSCRAGVCTLVEGGERCEGPRECRSDECVDNRCTGALVCESPKG